MHHLVSFRPRARALRTHRLSAFVVAVACSAVAVGGCGADTASKSADSGTGEAGTVTASPGPTGSAEPVGAPRGTIVDGAYVTPYSLDAVTGLTDGELKLTWEADERVRAECMAARGFDYVEAPVPQLVSAADKARLASDPSKAELEQYGYDWKTARRAGIAGFGSNGQEPVTQPTAPGYAEALDGDGVGGDAPCTQVAIETLKAGEYNAAEEPFNEAFANIANNVDADPQMADVLNAWVACMTAQGFAVSNNIDSAFLSQTDGQGQFIQGHERVALADYGCRDEVGYTQRRIDLINQKSQEWMDANPTALVAYQEAKVEYLALAKQALQ